MNKKQFIQELENAKMKEVWNPLDEDKDFLSHGFIENTIDNEYFTIKYSEYYELDKDYNLEITDNSSVSVKIFTELDDVDKGEIHPLVLKHTNILHTSEYLVDVDLYKEEANNHGWYFFNHNNNKD